MQPAIAHQVEADLFPETADDGPRLEFTGTLRADAQVRLKPVGPDSHMMPVLCMDIEHVGPGQHAMRAEQVFPASARHLADKAARDLRKGMQVRVTCSIADLRLYAPHIDRIQADPTPYHSH